VRIRRRASIRGEGRQFRDVGIRYKGNGTFLESRNSLKRSLKIDIGKYGNWRSLGDVRMLTLQNNVTDGSLMNEVLAYRLYRDADAVTNAWPFRVARFSKYVVGIESL